MASKMIEVNGINAILSDDGEVEICDYSEESSPICIHIDVLETICKEARLFMQGVNN